MPLNIKKKFLWIGLGILAIVLRAILSPEFIEVYYSRGLYLIIRSGFDFLGGLVPFSLFYIIMPLLFGILFFQWFKIIKRSQPLKTKLLNWLLNVFAWLGGLTFFFLFLWGFNYGRVPTEKQLNFEDREIVLGDLIRWVKSDAEKLAQMRIELGAKPIPVEDKLGIIRKNLQTVLQKNGYPSSSLVSCYPIRPNGILLRFSTSGVYIPFDGQGHIDNGLHPIQKPFVTAHEMAHAYGFTGEGICNFWAYISCYQSEDPFVRYSGAMGLWRYMASAWRFADPEGYLAFREELPKVLAQDLDEINASITAYPDIMPAFRDAIYDSFLKVQGMEDGLSNYDKIIPMVISWREKNGLLD
ncbi:MAG: DUF3810 domain-containing protein [Saprospiraceae bacterium]